MSCPFSDDDVNDRVADRLKLNKPDFSGDRRGVNEIRPPKVGRRRDGDAIAGWELSFESVGAIGFGVPKAFVILSVIRGLAGGTLISAVVLCEIAGLGGGATLIVGCRIISGGGLAVSPHI